jgi:3-hydroxybutyryl-CoA dehydrogenase
LKKERQSLWVNNMQINKVLVIGAGTMGRGIAQWFAQQEVEVRLTDVVSEMAEKSRAMIHESWSKLEEKGKFKAEQVNSYKNCLNVVAMEELPSDCDLVIEAIIEDERIKRELFLKLDQTMQKSCILASNTSSIPITTIARDLTSERKAKTLGLHFFNPATIMKLVEIINTNWTDKGVATKLHTWFKDAGKQPAICKDSPGFIVNRVARNFYGESLHILENHDHQRVEEIDKVMTEVGGFRMGPFTLMDLIGIDINYDVTQSVWNSYYNDPRFRPHKIQREMVESGRIGRKANEGFYKYE